MNRQIPSIVAALALIGYGDSDGGTLRTTATSTPSEKHLWMERFNGLEIYRIKRAEWNLYADGKSGRMNLWLQIECDGVVQQARDTADIGGKPRWELNLVEDGLSDSQLIKGYRAEIPQAYDESRKGWITNFIFVEHDGSEHNVIQVIDRKNDLLRIRVVGEVVDVNFYDDSKPRSKLLVETWFTRNSDGMRSMQ